MFAGQGSATSAANSCSAQAASSAGGSFQATTTVSAAAPSVTPGLPGTAIVASPEPASTSSASLWPW